MLQINENALDHCKAPNSNIGINTNSGLNAKIHEKSGCSIYLQSLKQFWLSKLTICYGQ